MPRMLLFDSLDNSGNVSPVPEGIAFLSHATHDANEMSLKHDGGQVQMMHVELAEEGGEGAGIHVTSHILLVTSHITFL